MVVYPCACVTTWTFWDVQVYPTHSTIFLLKSASVPIWTTYVPFKKYKCTSFILLCTPSKLKVYPSEYFEKCKCTLLILLCTPSKVQMHPFEPPIYYLKSTSVPYSSSYVTLWKCSCSHLNLICTPWKVPVYPTHSPIYPVKSESAPIWTSYMPLEKCKYTLFIILCTP